VPPKKHKTKTSRKTPSAPRLDSGTKQMSWIKRIFYFGAVAGVWGTVFGIVLIAYLSLDLPNLEDLPPPGVNDTAIVVKAANGATLVRRGPIYGDWISYQQTPTALIDAFLAVEDRHFFDHGGLDARGLARALWSNILAGGVRAGGSTITQQLAKNLFLSNKRTIKRKAQELLLALWLEQKFTKQQILTLYLNRVYFGGGAYGIDAAARKYYGHSATNLSIAEAALLAGLVKAPSRLAPHINPDGAWQRAQIVLGTMSAAGHLSKAAAAKIKGEPPFIRTATAGRDVRYFTDAVEEEAHRIAPNARGQSLVIYSTLDPAMQRAASMAVERGLNGEGKRRNASQAALVALDLDGALRAMVGGSDYGKSQYNRATQAQRQPGSAFKLFTYLAALENGLKPTDRFIDRATIVGNWAPKNYSGTFSGEMSAQEAFARSINTIAVQIAEQTGREKAANIAKRLGITTPISAVASLPLGTEEVKLIDLTSGYAAVANGGYLAPAYSVVEISTLEGEVLYRRRPTPPRAVLTYPVAKDMSDMMASVVRWGSGKNAALDRPAAGKSGTSQDNRDAVFAGFTSDMVTAVWVGNDDGSPMKNVTGGGLPARIWHDFMTEASASLPSRPLLADAGIFSAAALPTRPEDNRYAQQAPAPKKKKKSFFKRLFGGT
jgi:penicillin-binding protein 1A